MPLEPTTPAPAAPAGTVRASVWQASRVGLATAAALVLLGGLLAAAGARSLSDLIVVLAAGLAGICVVLGLVSLPSLAPTDTPSPSDAPTPADRHEPVTTLEESHS